MIKLEEKELNEFLELFNQEAAKKKLLKFVPASGAASRMFKSLYAAKDEGKSDKSVEQYHEHINAFAFYKSLTNFLKTNDKQEQLEALLGSNGLDYGNLPKGLLEFHAYGDTTRTALEEHLVEGAQYANNKGKVRLHFTVSPEHRKKFKDLINKVLKSYEASYNVKFDI